MGPSDVHYDAVLTNFAVEYKNAAFIAGLVFPIVGVKKKSDKYTVFNKKDRFTRPKTIRGPKDMANEIDWGKDEADYACITYALRDFLSDETVGNSDSVIQPRQRTVEILTNLILLDKEIRVAALAFTATNYAAAYKVTLAGGDQLDQYATSDPIGVIDTAKSALFAPANTVIMGKEVYDIIKRHPQMLDHVKGGATSKDPSKVGLAQMAEIFEVEQVLVGAAKYNISNKAKTASFSYIWGKKIAVAYIDSKVDLRNMSFGKTFQWTLKGGTKGYRARTYRDEAKGGGGEYIEVDTSFDEKIVCSDMGYLVSDAIS